MASTTTCCGLSYVRLSTGATLDPACSVLSCSAGHTVIHDYINSTSNFRSAFFMGDCSCTSTVGRAELDTGVSSLEQLQRSLLAGAFRNFAAVG